MAVSSLFTLIDDIAGVLDDVAAMTKIATKKTAGVLGDDLALNAQQVSGVSADRELPVVWAVAKGSLVNKLILVPAALAIGAFAPWAVTPLLMAGGLYLCFEGVEKLMHRTEHVKTPDGVPTVSPTDPALDLQTQEKTRIKGAIRTDFILSAEIIVIALGTVSGANFVTQLSVLVSLGLLMTVGVYGLVAGIVKLDDAGLWLRQRSGAFARGLGAAILGFAPWLMKGLSLAGTVAMFLVGGGILAHGIPAIGHAIEALGERLGAGDGTFGNLAASLTPMLLEGLVGVVAGGLALVVFRLVQRMRGPAAVAKPGH